MEWYLDGFVLVNINENEEEEDPVITFVETINGKQKACLGGHFYNMHCEIKRLRDGTKRYQCEKYTENCRAFIWERNGRATNRSENEHNHAPNAARIHHLQVGV